MQELLHEYKLDTGEEYITDKTTLDAFVNDVNASILKVSDRLLLQKKKRPHLKPYWNSNLSMLSCDQKDCWKQWVVAGRPRNPESAEWVRYKSAKREFRRMRREAESQFHISQIEQLCRQSEIDHKGFWYLINKVRKPPKVAVRPILGETGKMLTNNKDIAEDWRIFYEKLFTKASKGQGYDDGFCDHVEDSLPIMEAMSVDRPSTITQTRIREQEVEKTIKTLKNNKAPGFDRITNENLKYAGPNAVCAITVIFNSMIQLEHVPQCFKKGVIVPIPKGGGKDTTQKGNNRPITLLPCMYKVFEKVLLNRMDEWLASNAIISEMQGAFQAKCSSTDVVAMLQETVAHHRECENDVYIALLDVSKAFDSVWSEGLFYKLFNLGLEGKLWRILRQCYEGFTCEVLVNQTKSREFTVGRGVHQGAPLSMRLYQIYNNDLLNDLNTTNVSVGILDLKTGSPAFADDIAVVSLYKRTLNILLSMAKSHGRKWRYDYNAGKSMGLCFGKDLSQNQNLELGQKQIALSKGLSHMGVPLCTTKESTRDQITLRCDKVKKEVKVMLSMGSKSVPLPPTVASKIYKSICLPKLLYGLECSLIDDTSLQDLERTHRYCAKLIQGMPPQTPNPVAISTLGWLSIKSMLEIARIVWLYRWLSLPSTCIYKKIVLLRLSYHMYGNPSGRHMGPIYAAYKLYVTYGIECYIIDVMHRANVIPLKQFKRLILALVSEHEQTEWVATSMLYESLGLFRRCFQKIELCIWWKVSRFRPRLTRGIRTVMRLLCGQHVLAVSRRNRADGNSTMCNLCDGYEAETVSHFLFKCTHFSATRESAWKDVLLSMPKAMAEYVTGCNHMEKMIYVMSGLNSTFTQEWLDVYESVCVFVTKMYNKRCSSADEQMI